MFLLIAIVKSIRKMCDFWPFFVIFSQFLCIFMVFRATRIAPVDSIAHVSSFQSRLRSLYDLLFEHGEDCEEMSSDDEVDDITENVESEDTDDE